MPARSTTALADADAALAIADPVFARLVAAHGPCSLRHRRRGVDLFADLTESIVFQQLAGKAAAAIAARLVAEVGGALTPEAILGAGYDRLRSAGLSGAKAAAVGDLAAHVADGRLDLARLRRRPDDEVIAALVPVRGIGPWTAQMFLIFTLGRHDVWPVTDYGVRAGWAVAHGDAELPSPKALDTMGEHLRPYRSVAAWYCWRALEASRA